MGEVTSLEGKIVYQKAGYDAPGRTDDGSRGSAPVGAKSISKKKLAHDILDSQTYTWSQAFKVTPNEKTMLKNKSENG